MRNLERAVRLFRALVETGSDVQVTSSTLWSWPEVQAALGSSGGDRALLVEMQALPEAVRERTMRYCGAFDPVAPKGDVYVFPSTDAADKFVAEMEDDLGAVATHLADGVVSAYGETPDSVTATAIRFGGSLWTGPSLADAFESVDTDLPYAMLQEGFDPGEVQDALIEALWKDRDVAINETFFLHAPADKPSGKFRGRLAQWATPRPVFGVNPRLFEALRMSGALPRRLCGLVEADPNAPAVSPPSPGAATAGGQSGATAQDDTPGGQPAQSQEPPQKEAPKPTEHVPTKEEGGTAMGQVKLPDGTVVPPEVMRQALGKMLHNLATQVEQGTTNGKPADKPKDQDAQDKQPEPPEVETPPAEEPKQPEQPEQAAAPAQQPAAAPAQQPPQQESITEDLRRALGLLKSPRPNDVIAGVGLVQQTGFSGQPQSVVERVLDEFDALKDSPNARVRRAINDALAADLYRASTTMIPVLPEGLHYGEGRECAPGTPVVIVEDRGSKVVLRLPTGETVLVSASSVALVEVKEILHSWEIANESVRESNGRVLGEAGETRALLASDLPGVKFKTFRGASNTRWIGTDVMDPAEVQSALSRRGWRTDDEYDAAYPPGAGQGGGYRPDPGFEVAQDYLMSKVVGGQKAAIEVAHGNQYGFSTMIGDGAGLSNWLGSESVNEAALPEADGLDELWRSNRSRAKVAAATTAAHAGRIKKRLAASVEDDQAGLILGDGALYNNPNPLAPKRRPLGEARDWGRDILKLAAQHKGKLGFWFDRVKELVRGGDDDSYDDAVNVLVGAFGMNRLPPDVQALLNAWEIHWNPVGESRVVSEQLDVGQEDEKVAAAKGFKRTADKLKACRSHTFDLVTSDLVQLESLAKAIGAKRTTKMLGQVRDKATDFLDALKETAELLDKANEAFKGEGGKGGDTIDQEQQAAAAPVVMAAPAPAPVEVAVAEAIRRAARTSIPRRIAAGESYQDIVESLQSVTSDMGLSKQQIAEVYDKINTLSLHDDGTPEFSVELSSTDHRLLESVQRYGGLVRGLVQRTRAGSPTLATRTELSEAASTLRKYGKVEHGMLADDLEAIVTKAC